MRLLAAVCALLCTLLYAGAAAAQQAPEAAPPATVELGERGLVVRGADGVTSVAFRFRLQPWMVLTADEDGGGISETTFALRHARFLMESVVLDPRLAVNVQLSFSRGDLDLENSGTPNILRDATVRWAATEQLTLMAGQTKLPGNRQRLVSSGALQFADRSILNGAFNVDRDVGVWVDHVSRGARPVRLRAAVSGGEGRNAARGDGGLAYTARVEFLPLGAFTAGGEYVEGDLAREAAPRVAIGAALSVNQGATRTAGQTGTPLFAARDMETSFLDVVFKYRGFAASVEAARRNAADPITASGSDTSFVLAGSGYSAQASFLTRSDLEPAVRFSVVDPHRSLGALAPRHRQASVGVTRYLQGHRVKMQAELLRDARRDRMTRATQVGWSVRASMEVGL